MTAPALTYRDVVRLLKAIPARSSANPILSHVLCEPCALDGSPSASAVRLTAVATATQYSGSSTVLYARICMPLPAGSALSGPVALPAGPLVSALTRCKGMPVLSGPAPAGPALSVCMDGATVQALDAADFPFQIRGIPSADGDPSWIATAAAVLPASSDDDTRTGLNGVHVESSGGVLRFAATDGHRLHVATAPGDLPSDGGSTLLPRAWIKLAASLPVQSCGVDGSAVLARGADFVLGSLRPEGEFPDFRQVIPGTEARTLTVASAALSAALKRAAEVMGTARGCAVRAVCGVRGSDALRLLASGDGGAIDLPIDGAEYSGESLVIGFNARYLADAVAFCGGDAVELGIGDALSPVLVASARTDRLAIVMPQRIES